MKIFEGENEVYIKLETPEEIRALHILANAFNVLTPYSAEASISESDSPRLLPGWPPAVSLEGARAWHPDAKPESISHDSEAD